MKRIGNLYEQICCIENLRKAELKARKRKSKQLGVIEFDKNREENLIKLSKVLLDGTYNTSKYYIFKLKEKKKEREIYRLPYYPDRIVHHAIMNILERIFVSSFTVDTYSCIRKRGIHKCSKNLGKALKDKENTEFCLKFDIKKFYPSVNHDILKLLLRKKFKDERLLILLDEIISSAPGLPIGNYLSQYLANFYLNYFDHWLKEVKLVPYMFRYCDDIVILYKNKKFLHQLRRDIQHHLKINLKLELSNYQIFPVHTRGIDFVGYKRYHNKVLLRKSIKNSFKTMIKRYPNRRSKASYNGWITHCNGINLSKKYMKNDYRK